MLHFIALESTFRRLRKWWRLSPQHSLGASGTALAANRVIPKHRLRAYSCSSVNPGDTVTLPAGTRGPLKITNCKGTPVESDHHQERPGAETVRPSYVVPAGSSGGFIFNCKTVSASRSTAATSGTARRAGKTYGIKADDDGRRRHRPRFSGSAGFPASSRFATSRLTGHGPRSRSAAAESA